MLSLWLRFHQWLLSMAYRALERAYRASKRARDLQRECMLFQGKASSKEARHNMALYTDSVLNRASREICWALWQLRIISLIARMAACPAPTKGSGPTTPEGGVEAGDAFQIMGRRPSLLVPCNVDTALSTEHSSSGPEGNANSPLCGLLRRNEGAHSAHRSSTLLRLQRAVFGCRRTQAPCVLLAVPNRVESRVVNRRIAWIEATLFDLTTCRRRYWETTVSKADSVFEPTILALIPAYQASRKPMAHESVGLVPRSITRTLARFRTELAGMSASLVIPELKLAKYQAVASLQYMASLALLPWSLSVLCKVLVLEPLIKGWWDTVQPQVFVTASQEARALRRLQEIEELLWLNIILADDPMMYPQKLSAQVHQQTVGLVDLCHQKSIQTMLYLSTDIVSLISAGCLLTWGKKRLAILNSWAQELFYSLSDTMKAFFILLLTDLCIGFHSPHGWELLIGLFLEHLGFSHNKHVVSCFVSTFPVILDTVFKYWIFRHLNRISPSIVVTYHTMNE